MGVVQQDKVNKKARFPSLLVSLITLWGRGYCYKPGPVFQLEWMSCKTRVILIKAVNQTFAKHALKANLPVACVFK